MRVDVMLRHPSTTWAFVTMKPSSETITPLASEYSSADSSQVKNKIRLANHLNISSADITTAAAREVEGLDGRGAGGLWPATVPGANSSAVSKHACAGYWRYFGRFLSRCFTESPSFTTSQPVDFCSIFLDWRLAMVLGRLWRKPAAPPPSGKGLRRLSLA
jgi:hypothetical protein